MKKIFALVLSLTMTAAMFTSCGDTADTNSNATTTAANDVSLAPEASLPESTADVSTAEEEVSSAAESVAEESSAAEESGSKKDDEAKPKDIKELPSSLLNYDKASFKFSKDTKIDKIVKSMNNKDYSDDESKVKFSIEELAGIPMLKVETLDKNKQDEYKVPKIQFMMNELFKGKESELPKIFSIKVELVTKAVEPAINDKGDEVMVPAFFGGKLVTQPSDGKGSNSWNELYEFGESEWTSEWASYEITARPGIKDQAKFLDTKDPQYLAIMKWSIKNNACFYVADIQFLDEDGNVIECADIK